MAGLCLVLAGAVRADEAVGSMAVKLAGETAEIYPLEPVTMVYIVQNVGTETVKYFPYHQLWSFEYKGRAGAKSEQPRGPWVRYGDMPEDYVVHFGPGAVSRLACNPSLELVHVSGEAGTYRVRAMVWSSGKATLDERRLRWLQATENKVQPAKVGLFGEDPELAELRAAQDQTQDQGLAETAEEPRYQEIACWKGKAVSNELEIRMRPLESADDQKAYALLLGARTPETFVWEGVAWAKLRQVLQDYPDSVYAKYCAFYLAEAARTGYSEVITIQAMKLYQKVIDDYKPFQFTDDAKFYVANYHYREREPQKARALLEEILKAHPGTSGALAAEKLLAKLPPAAEMSPAAAGSSGQAPGK